MEDPRGMQAAVYYGANDLRIERRSIPEIGEDEVLVAVKAASICGTDLRIYQGGHRKFPPGTVRILGHEVVGEIAAAGTKVSDVEVGNRVFIAPNIGCGVCRQCTSGRNNLCPDYTALGVTIDGAFAEFMRVPAQGIHQGNLIPIGDRIDMAVAALIEPFACVLHGQDAIQPLPGESVLIVGAGPIGLMHLLLARFRGAGRVLVSEISDARLAAAKNFGADDLIHPEKENLQDRVMKATGGEGADVIIVAAPSPGAQGQAPEIAAVGGRINFFGGLSKENPTIELNSNLVHYKELVVTGTTGCSTHDCRRAAEIVLANKVDLSGLVSKRYPLERSVEAFEEAQKREGYKVVLEPG